jgi:Protein of unknown function (DUF4231)
MATSGALAHHEQVKQFQKKLQDQIDGFRNEGDFNRAKSFRGTSLFIVFSAITTVLIGIGQKGILKDYGELLSIAALITSAVTFVWSSWESFFSYRSRWVAFNDAASKATGIQERLEYLLASGHLTQSELDGFFAEFQDVRATAHSGWSQSDGGGKK